MIDYSKLSLSEWNDCKATFACSSPTNDQKYFALNLVLQLLHSNNIKYYLSGGTLLGLYRDNDLIPWDDDIDIDLTHDSDPESLNIIRRFAIHHDFPYRIGNNLFHPKITLFISGAKVSICRLHKGYFNSYYYRPKVRIPISILFPLKQASLSNGVHYFIPAEPSAYLKHLYGSSWNTLFVGNKTTIINITPIIIIELVFYIPF